MFVTTKKYKELEDKVTELNCKLTALESRTEYYSARNDIPCGSLRDKSNYYTKIPISIIIGELLKVTGLQIVGPKTEPAKIVPVAKVKTK